MSTILHNLLFDAHTQCMNYVTKMIYWLDLQSVVNNYCACLVHGQGQKREQKYTTKNFVGFCMACERRRISGCHLVPPKNNVCEPEPENDFCDVGILSQSQSSSNNPRTTARGIRCEKHSSFILSWNLIGQGGTKVITSQKSFPGSGSQTLFFGGTK